MKGMSMMIPAGGETSASRDRRLMNDAISAAGRRLIISSCSKIAKANDEILRLTEMLGKCRGVGRIELDT
jgi:hypothetical protein